MTIETEKSRVIPVEEIRQDIADTKAEIHDLDRKLANINAMPYPTKLDDMRRSAYESGIKERAAFIVKLEALLAERGYAP